VGAAPSSRPPPRGGGTSRPILKHIWGPPPESPHSPADNPTNPLARPIPRGRVPDAPALLRHGDAAVVPGAPGPALQEEGWLHRPLQPPWGQGVSRSRQSPKMILSQDKTTNTGGGAARPQPVGPCGLDGVPVGLAGYSPRDWRLVSDCLSSVDRWESLRAGGPAHRCPPPHGGGPNLGVGAATADVGEGAPPPFGRLNGPPSGHQPQVSRSNCGDRSGGRSGADL